MKHRIRGSTCTAAVLAAGIIFLQTGCGGEQGDEETPLLPEARPDETNFSPFTPRNPYKEAGTNLLERKVFQALGPGGIKIELLDLFVLPGKTADHISLPGPAVLEVLSGEGKITNGDKPQELRTGTTFSIAQGASLSLESKSGVPLVPLVVRARVFAPGGSP
jgi:hypothetical protein